MVTTILIGFSCGAESFNTNFDPPGEGVKIGEIYPKLLENIPPKYEFLPINDQENVFGHRAIYGDIAEIQSIQTKGGEYQDNFFREYIVGNFFQESFQTKSSGQYNGTWIARGTKKDGTRLYAWTQKNWVYLIQAKDSTIFQQAITEFPYIEAK